jgi:pyrroline-5-carboxylate reductase
MRIGILGTGTITSAVVSGLAGQGHDIVVSARNAQKSAALAARFAEVSVADNQAVLDQSDVIFLGLMAEVAPAVLADLQFDPRHQVISVMAGATLEDVAWLVGPATAVSVMMPFPGIAEGGSPIMALGGDDLLTALFAPRNTVYSLASAAELQAYLCAQAVLSPAVKMVADASDWLAGQVSDSAQGEAFLRHLVGSSLLASECAPMLEALNTPGGYNQRLREHMVEAGFSAHLRVGLEALRSGGT